MIKFDPVDGNFDSLDNEGIASKELRKNILEIHGLIRDVNRKFPCPGARQVFTNGNIYVSEHRGKLTDPETAEQVLTSVKSYAGYTNIRALQAAATIRDIRYQTFLSLFPNATFTDQLDAALQFHTLLKNIMEADPNKDAAEKYSRNPDERNFSMHVDGVPYFMASFHPLNGDNPRKTRNAVGLNWNTHYVFDLLKNNQLFRTWEHLVRNGIIQNHGAVHEDLLDHDTASEVFQYVLVDPPLRQQLGAILGQIYGISGKSHIFLSPEEYRKEALKLREERKLEI